MENNLYTKYLLLSDDELMHYGIEGQKWGVRRWQNEDGSLTEEGRIHYGYNSKSAIKRTIGKYQYESDRKKLQKQIIKEKEETNKPKKISEMSDEELRTYINRKTNEKNAYQLNVDIARLNPKSQSFIEKMGNKVINESMNAAMNVGKQYLEKYLREQTGLNNKSSETREQKAKREADYWNNMKNIAVNQKQYYDNMSKIKSAVNADFNGNSIKLMSQKQLEKAFRGL